MPYRDPDRKREYNRLWFRAKWLNDEAFRELHRQRNREGYYGGGWASRSRQRMCARSANQQAAKLGVPGSLTAADIEQLWERQPTCVSCGEGRGVDHIVAMVAGGANVPSNLQNLCVSCNQVKNKWALSPDQIEKPPFAGDAQVCRRGHARSIYMRQMPSGGRYCTQCHKQSVARYRARKEAA